MHIRCFIPRILFSASLLAIAAAAPALATVTLNDNTGTSVTLFNDGTIAFTCKGITHLAAGNEGYVVCVNNATSGPNVGISTSPASGAITLTLGQTMTVSALSTTLSGKLGIHTFLTWTGGTCTFDVTQKIFNKSSDIIKITQYKRVADVNVDGDGADDTFVGGSTSLTVLASDVHTVTLSGGGNTGATNALAYSAPAPKSGELGTCGMTAGATRMSVTGDRVLVVRYNFTPGYVGLKPAGQAGSEKFFSVRYTVQ